MWKNLVVYDSRLDNAIVTLGGEFYRVLEVVSTTPISLMSTKQHKKVISLTGKNFLFMIRFRGEWNIMEKSTNSTQGLSTY